MRGLVAVSVVVAVGLAACAAAPRVPALRAPEIVISLRGRTLHVIDRATHVSKVYRVRPGALRPDGHSITPTGRFATGPDPADRWWYMPHRDAPAEYGGHPFIRITARNARGQYVYGLHGPIEPDVAGEYVSRGCVRLRADDIRELYALVHEHPSTPVTIIEDVERDDAGHVVDVTAGR